VQLGLKISALTLKSKNQLSMQTTIFDVEESPELSQLELLIKGITNLKNWRRRSLLVGGSACVGALAMRGLYETPIPFGTAIPEAQLVGANRTVLNDASELSPTVVTRHVIIEKTPEIAKSMLLAELAEARKAGRGCVVHTGRHSMGGQSLLTDGTAITLDQDWIEIDQKAQTYRVAAGMRWSKVIAALDAQGLSPKVMQSNNDFGVASTFSVNAHGWPVTYSGGGTTARRANLILASGEEVICSRSENPKLFSAALGGYGLLGVVTELEMEAKPNLRLTPTFNRMPAKDFGIAFETALRNDQTIDMAYGRMNISIAGFFEEALLITYRPAPNQDALPAASTSGFIAKVSRDIFRQQVGSDRWKRLRWNIETNINQVVNAGEVTRNSLLNEPVITLDDQDPTRTDILHEYFIAPQRWAEFVDLCQHAIPSSFQELLNITLRFVDTDQDSMLAYATVPRVAAVLLFSQEKSTRAEADMARMTSELIEGVLAIGGSYYLPYRPHASVAQFRNAYQRHNEFLAAKREVDPGLLFRNGLWENYLSKI
jgi:FAD/FMN-containing dehydrogenase